MGDPAVATATEKALSWLEVRGCSRAQLEARLHRAAFSEAVACAVGQRLVDLGVLSDRELALAGVQTGLRKGLSRAYLRRQLEGRGVSCADVVWALEESAIEEPEADRALNLARAWARSHPSETGEQAHRRLGALLLRRGYEEELAGDVCRAVLGELGDLSGALRGVPPGARID